MAEVLTYYMLFNRPYIYRRPFDVNVISPPLPEKMVIGGALSVVVLN
jgi:hypothetical protein